MKTSRWPRAVVHPWIGVPRDLLIASRCVWSLDQAGRRSQCRLAPLGATRAGSWHMPAKACGAHGDEELEPEDAEETAKVAALRRAADEGWSDLASGRYDDVDDEALDSFVAILAWSHERFGGKRARATRR